MPQLRSRLNAMLLDFGDDLLVGKLLQYPLASAIQRQSDRVTGQLRSQAETIVDHLPPLELHRRQFHAEVSAEPIEIVIDADRDNPAWRTPIPLTVHAFVWQSAKLHHAVIPTLGMSVVAPSRDKLLDRARSQIRFVLGREVARSLKALLSLPRPQKVRCVEYAFDLEAPTLKERARSESDSDRHAVLAEIGDNLGRRGFPPIQGREPLVRQIGELLSQPRPTSVLLVGDSGVGKSAIVGELIRSRRDLRLPFRAYWQTNGSRIVAGMSDFGAWQERCEALRREVIETEAFVHLGSLYELMEVGQHESSQQGIGDYLRPAIASGKLPCTVECTPQQLEQVSQRNPRMLDAFEQIEVPETTPEVTREILGDLASRILPGETGAIEDAMDTSVRLHERFASYSARPGRVARFFTYLLEDVRAARKSPRDTGQRPPALDSRATFAAFSRQTGLPLAMLDEAVLLDLDAAETWFTQRVLGQPDAIARVVDALASIKSGLTRPGRPIASFLFIGPTGVGKTELSKALTEYLYHSDERMTRIDMSEYSDPLAAERLAGAGWQQEGLLTSRVREQPFGVVLLDEFEKAHPDVFDLLLQILGEGRLTDAAGRVADFSSSVVIMTSNLGAESASKANFGFQDRSQTEQAGLARLSDHYTTAVQKFLRPEIFNRIDSIIPFDPLSRATVKEIVTKQLHAVEQRVVERIEGTEVRFDDSVVRLISERGYQPTLGARPIKREIDRTVLAPISSALNQRKDKSGCSVISVSVERDNVQVALRKRVTNSRTRATAASAHVLANRVMNERRTAVRLGANFVVDDKRNRMQYLERRVKQQQKRKKPIDEETLRQLYTLQSELDQVADQVRELREFEERALMSYYRGELSELGAIHRLDTEVDKVESRNKQLLLNLFSESLDAQVLSLVLFGYGEGRLTRLADAYEELLKGWGHPFRRLDLFARPRSLEKLPKLALPITTMRVKRALEESDDRRNIKPHPSLEFFAMRAGELSLRELGERICGAAFEIKHPLAAARLQDESGIHRLIEEGVAEATKVVAFTGTLKNYEPPQARNLWSQLRSSEAARTYDYDKRLTYEGRAQQPTFEIKMKRRDSVRSMLELFAERSVDKRAWDWFQEL